jgi:hypothetical protein
MLVDAEPGSPGRWVQACYGAHGTFKNLRWLAPTRICLLAIRPGYQRSVFDEPEEDRQETHTTHQYMKEDTP